MEKILNTIINALAMYASIAVMRDEQRLHREIANLKNRLLWTRISLITVTAGLVGGFVI